MTPEEHIKRIAESNRHFADWFNRTLPHLVGARAVQHFKESCQSEGFTDEVLVKWTDVKRRTNPKRVDRAAASIEYMKVGSAHSNNPTAVQPPPNEV